jgi:hypothetical protein
MRATDWFVSQSPMIEVEEVAALGQCEKRMVITFAKDFGELVFKRRRRLGVWGLSLRTAPRPPRGGRASSGSHFGGAGA